MLQTGYSEADYTADHTDSDKSYNFRFGQSDNKRQEVSDETGNIRGQASDSLPVGAMTLSITTLSIKRLCVTLSSIVHHNDIQHDGQYCDTQHNNTRY